MQPALDFTDLSILVPAIVMFLLSAGALTVLILAMKAIKRSTSRLDAIQEILPDRELVVRLGGVSAALGKAIQQHEATVRAFPELVADTVSTEVQRGLQPLGNDIQLRTQEMNQRLAAVSQSLLDGHSVIQKTMLTINDDGSLGEWVGTLQNAVTPLQTAAQSVEQHYQASRRILESLFEMSKRWAGHWERIEQSFVQFNDIVAQRQANEAALMAETEHRILNRLEEVAESYNLVGRKIDALNSTVDSLAGSQQIINKTVDNLFAVSHSLLDRAERLQGAFEIALEKQNKFQEAFCQWQLEINSKIEAYPIRLQEMTDTALGLLKDMKNQYVTIMDDLQRRSQTMAGAFDALTKNFFGFVKKYEADQQQALERMSEAMTEWRSAVTAQASQKFQIAQLVFMVFQACLLGALLYVLAR